MMSSKHTEGVSEVFYTSDYAKDVINKDSYKVPVKISKIGQYNTFGVMEILSSRH